MTCRANNLETSRDITANTAGGGKKNKGPKKINSSSSVFGKRLWPKRGSGEGRHGIPAEYTAPT